MQCHHYGAEKKRGGQLSESLGVFYISRTIFHGTQFAAYGSGERRFTILKRSP